MTRSEQALTLAQTIYAEVCAGRNVRLDRADGCVSLIELFDTRTTADAVRGIPPQWELSIESTLPSFRGDTGHWGKRVLDGIVAIADASTRVRSSLED
jgi:hypothetical protein